MRRFLAVALCLWSFAAWGQGEPSGLMLGGRGITAPAGLVGRWLAGNGAGVSGTTANDLTSLGSPGTLVNAPTVTSQQVGGGLSFVAASSQSVGMGNVLSFEGTQAWSITTWVSSSASATSNLVSKQQPSGSFLGYGLGTDATGHFQCLVYNGTGVIITSTSAYNDGVRRLVECVYTGSGLASGMALLVNGAVAATSVTQNNLSGSVLSTTPFNISGRNGTNNFCTCTQNDVRLYNIALSLSSSVAIYNAGLNGRASNDNRLIVVARRDDLRTVANGSRPLLDKLLGAGS